MTTVEKFEQNIDQVNSDFQAIKSKLIECGVEVADGTRTAELADKVGQVYKSAKDAWWDVYQQNGNRTNYKLAFGGTYWDDTTFTPIFPLVNISDGYMMFAYSKISHIGRIEATVSGNMQYGFYYSSLLEQIDYVKCGRFMYGAFSNCSNLHTLILELAPSSIDFTGAFEKCYALVNLIIIGTISNNFNVSPCTKLSKASITSIINNLSDTTSGLTVTLSGVAVDTAFELVEGDGGGSSEEDWINLEASKPNWNIVLNY